MDSRHADCGTDAMHFQTATNVSGNDSFSIAGHSKTEKESGGSL